MVKLSADNDTSSEIGSVVLEKDPDVKHPPSYQVVLINDDYTPMEFVVYILQSFFNMNQEKATQVMLAVHQHGKGVCGIYTKEVAETKCSQVLNFAKENGHPLACDIEPVDED